jgi:hypothetical protein
VPAALSDFEGNILFLPDVAQAALTPLNTVGLFTDLSYDDDELRDEATQGKADDILTTLHDAGFRLPPDALSALMPPPAPALGPAEARVVTAGLGQAPTVGRLSVPQAWTVAAPEIRLAALTSPASSLGAAPEVMAAGPGTLFSEMTLANMASRAISGAPTPGSAQRRVASFAGVRRVSATPASPTGHGKAIAADVHEFAEALMKLGDLRDSGLLTDEEFIKEKDRLLAR